MIEQLFGVLSMLLIVGAVLALAYLVTRYLAGRGLGMAGAGRGTCSMKLLEQLPLGREQRLMLVQIGEQFLLLGVTATQITQLGELTGEEGQRWLQQMQKDAQQASAMSFAQALKQSLTQKKDKGGL